MTAFTFSAALPSLDMPASAFDAACESMVRDLEPFAAAMDAHAVAADASATAANVSAAAAAAAANYKGAWASLSGAQAIPASVSHAGTIWVLVANVANVAAHTPGVSASWVRAYPQRRLPIVSASTSGLAPITTLDQLHNTAVAVGINATTVEANAAHFVAAEAGSASNVAQSTDGRTWALRAMPAAGVWHVVSDGTTFVAMREGATGSTATTRSTDGFITRTDFAFGDTWAGALAGKVAGGGGNFISQLSSGQVAISTGNGGVSWLGQTAPITVAAAFVTTGGLYVIKAAGNAYYTSVSGFTGSWTLRALPTGCDTIVRDWDGTLLAYQAGSITTAVHRSADGVVWSPAGWLLPHTTTAPRSINGIGLAGAVSGGVVCWSAHGGAWVPRTSTLRFDATRQVARVGNVNVLVNSGTAYVLDATAGDAGMSTWE